MSNVLVQEILVREFDAANQFYNQVGYRQGIQPQDRVVTAKLNGETVGVGRIAFEHDVLVLRGMQVHQSVQRQGIGNLILDKLDEIIGKSECFCIPHGWLDKFYGQIGFKTIDPTDGPKFLQERFLDNKKKYPQLIMMMREKA